ncbi:MAG: nitroreductase family protein [Planctomycetota bacterium]|jgi:nitroreductase/ferredoxin|nr:nitroreductase family protein [Planctomycetota bacterium]
MSKKASSDSCRFQVNSAICIGCGECVEDCVAEILELRDGRPQVKAGEESNGLACQHCLAICPVGAASVLGLSPANSDLLPETMPSFQPVDFLVRARRSVRRFSERPVPVEVIRKLIDLAAYAPTGVNTQGRLFTVLAEPGAMNRFRRTTMTAILKAEKRGGMPEAWDWLPDLVRKWENGGKDEVFRNAPHLLVISNHQDAPCVQPDGFIAMSYFDLLAQASGIGTVWGGIPYALISSVCPELQVALELPSEQEFVYCMMFGYPEVNYRRTVQRKAENVHFLR